MVAVRERISGDASALNALREMPQHPAEDLARAL
jgi:hypothetical protein